MKKKLRILGIKLTAITLILAMATGCSGCSLVDLSKFVGPAEEISSSLSSALNSFSALLSTINRMVASGELQQSIADMANDIVTNTMTQVDRLTQNTAGLVFNQANGLISQTLASITTNLEELLHQLSQGTIPDILSVLRTESERLINTISNAVQDIVVVTAGNVVIVVSTIANTLLVVLCLILLGLVAVLFVILFLRWRANMRAPLIAILSILCVFALFFILVLVVPPLRASIVAGIGFGNKQNLPGMEATISSIAPDSFILGENDRIELFGRNLDTLKDPVVKLFRGSTEAKTFPPALVNCSKTRISISGLAGESGWASPTYASYRSNVLDPLQLAGDTYDRALAQIRGNNLHLLYPTVLALAGQTVAVFKLPKVQRGLEITRFFDSMQANLKNATKDFDQQTFGLQQGDYTVRVFSGGNAVQSQQILSLQYPEPPARLPDLAPYGASWTTAAAKGDTAMMQVRLRLSDGDQVRTAFNVQVDLLSPVYGVTTMTKEVSPAEFQSRPNASFLDVFVGPWALQQSGIHQFRVFADSSGKIQEVDKANNQARYQLKVGQYKYNVTLTNIILTCTYRYPLLSPTALGIPISLTRNSSNEQKIQVTLPAAGDSVSAGSNLSQPLCNYDDSLSLSTSFTAFLTSIFTIPFHVGPAARNFKLDNTYVDEAGGSKSTPLTLTATGTGLALKIDTMVKVDPVVR